MYLKNKNKCEIEKKHIQKLKLLVGYFDRACYGCVYVLE